MARNRIRRLLLSITLLALLLAGCSPGVGGPPWNLDSGPEAKAGLPSGKVVAAWIERTALPYGSKEPEPGRILVLDEREQASALPTSLTDECHPNVPLYLGLSPDATKLAMVVDNRCDDPKTSEFHIIDVQTGARLSTLRGGGELGTFAWAPDSERLAITTRPGGGRVVNGMSGEVLAQLVDGTRPEWAPGDKIMLATDSDEHQYVSFEPDGTRLVLFERVKQGRWLSEGIFLGQRFKPGEDPKTSLYGVNGQPRKEWSCPGPLPISPDGRTTVGVAYTTPDETTGDKSPFIETCDVASGELKPLSPNFTFTVHDVAWLPSGRVATIVFSTFQTIDPDTGEHTVRAKAAKDHYYHGLTTSLGYHSF